MRAGHWIICSVIPSGTLIHSGRIQMTAYVSRQIVCSFDSFNNTYLFRNYINDCIGEWVTESFDHPIHSNLLICSVTIQIIDYASGLIESFVYSIFSDTPVHSDTNHCMCEWVSELFVHLIHSNPLIHSGIIHDHLYEWVTESLM